MGAILVVQGQHAEPVGVERAGAVALAAVDAVVVALGHQAGADVRHVLAASFRKGVGEAVALEHQVEEEALLFLGALQADVLQQAVVVLRNLPKRRIGRRDDGDHLGQGGEGHLSATVLARHRDTPQSAVGERVDHVRRHLAVAVALGGAFTQQRCDAMGDGDGLRIVANDLGIRLADVVVGGNGGSGHGFLEIVSAKHQDHRTTRATTFIPLNSNS
ncbi:hypothetical protein D3C85_1096290 [compost metagenome]